MAIKIKLWCDSGDKSSNRREEEVQVSELGYSDEEWNNLSESDRYDVAFDWANKKMEIGYVEIG